jgi:hypothetical protein
MRRSGSIFQVFFGIADSNSSKRPVRIKDITSQFNHRSLPIRLIKETTDEVIDEATDEITSMSSVSNDDFIGFVA